MRFASLFVAVLIVLFCASCSLHNSGWPALDPTEFQRPTPIVDPAAGAEILLRESIASNSPIGFEVRHVIRARVFTAEGVERLSRIDIPYERSFDIVQVQARTIRPDGSILKVPARDIYDRETTGEGNLRTRVKSFAPPGLEPGAIIEYRYTQFSARMMQYLPLFFQGSLPARLVRYRVRPFAPATSGTRALFLNFPPRDLTPDAEDYLTFEMVNIPAAKDEPYRPPAMQAQPVVILYHTDAGATPPRQYWTMRGMNLHRESQSNARITPALEQVARQIVAAQASPTGQLEALHDYCRTRIANRDRATSGFSPEQRIKLGNNANAADTLRKGHGSPSDINTLFLALARAAGFDAHAVLANDRSFLLYDEKMIEPFVFTDSLVGVRSGDGWSFFDPGSIYLAAGLVPWRNTDTSALIADEIDPIVREIPGAPAAASLRSRKATLKLHDSGVLEGTVTLEYTGLWAAEMKRDFDPAPAAARTARVQQDVLANLPGAEVSNVVVENGSDVLKPLKVSFQLRVPRYADRAATRLFFQPVVLKKGEPPRFEAPSRMTDVALHYRSTELDDIEITLPPGYRLEGLPPPSEFDMGYFGQYELRFHHDEAKPAVLSCRRRLTIDEVLVERARYPSLKAAFDEMHIRDNRMVRLNRVSDAP